MHSISLDGCTFRVDQGRLRAVCPDGSVMPPTRVQNHRAYSYRVDEGGSSVVYDVRVSRLASDIEAVRRNGALIYP
jgi:hypothetical protein